MTPQAANKDVLICVFQRGAADGLNLVVPHGDPNYYLKRPTIGIPKPNQMNGANDLSAVFPGFEGPLSKGVFMAK